MKKEKNIDKYNQLSDDILLLRKYRKRIKILPEAKKTIGQGVPEYKQPKRNAYKIHNNSYGGLMINMPKLLNEMVIEAQKGGQIVYEDKADKSLIDLLTKRFNPKRANSSKAKQILNNLNLLANMPNHRSSGKSKLGGAIYSNPEDLMKRLTLLTGSPRPGNTLLALRNEVLEIIDHLLKNGIITKLQHDQYVLQHLI